MVTNCLSATREIWSLETSMYKEAWKKVCLRKLRGRSGLPTRLVLQIPRCCWRSFPGIVIGSRNRRPKLGQRQEEEEMKNKIDADALAVKLVFQNSRNCFVSAMRTTVCLLSLRRLTAIFRVIRKSRATLNAVSGFESLLYANPIFAVIIGVATDITMIITDLSFDPFK